MSTMVLKTAQECKTVMLGSAYGCYFFRILFHYLGMYRHTYIELRH